MNIVDILNTIAAKLDIIADKLDKLPTVLPIPSACRYTLFEWLDEWFNTYRAPKLRDGGYDLKHTIKKHVKPNIADKPLNEYTAHDISKALNLIKSERMRQISRQVYNQAFREAVRAGYIDRNPVDNVDGVSHKYKNGRALEHDEQAEFLQVTAHDRYNVLFRFYLLTGARPSEPFAVTWSDITEDTIRIPGTKTVRSDRYLPLSTALKNLLDEIPKNRMRLFPYTYQAMSKHFVDYVRPKLSFYMTIKDLRHTFGTRCIECGVSMKTVQKWLGHSNYGTTANIYSHITTDFERAEVEKLNAAPLS